MVGPNHRSAFTASSAALLLVFLFLQANAVAAEQATSTAGRPDLSTLIRRIAEAQLDNGNRVKPYSVTREYKVFGGDAIRPRTEVVAKVNFLPPNVKSYDIDQSTGGMGEKIVRHILDHEVDATRDPRTLMVNEQNYSFAFIGEDMLDGNSCYRLTIAPKHERKDLLKATIWVDKNSYHIVRMEGEPAKSPSFWVKDVHLVLEFDEVAGMWLQTETHAMAHLRFGGEYKITSQDIGYDVSPAIAANVHRVAAHRRHSSALMAASVR
jgi:hypothetical protein